MIGDLVSAAPQSPPPSIRPSTAFGESRLYTRLGAEFDGHRTVHHASGEYARYEVGQLVTTNTVENVFSILKRGMKGVYQHCGEARDGPSPA